jgi:hypothetical protein
MSWMNRPTMGDVTYLVVLELEAVSIGEEENDLVRRVLAFRFANVASYTADRLHGASRRALVANT